MSPARNRSAGIHEIGSSSRQCRPCFAQCFKHDPHAGGVRDPPKYAAGCAYRASLRRWFANLQILFRPHTLHSDQTDSQTKQMEDIQQKIERLKSIVDTARQEVDLAVMFHETWRPAAYDTDLHSRIGTSYASHAFQIIRMSLRRELILALTRLWDKDDRAVRMSVIAHHLGDKAFFEALVQYRARRLGLRSMFVPDRMREELTSRCNQVLKLIRKYSQGGTAFEVLEKLKRLRHEHLAHRQLPGVPVSVAELDASGREKDDEMRAWPTDDQIEAFYQDNLEILRLLLSVVNGMAYDLSESANVYKHYAKFFWASARGERTEGHPDYCPPLSTLPRS